MFNYGTLGSVFFFIALINGNTAALLSSFQDCCSSKLLPQSIDSSTELTLWEACANWKVYI